jgi:hypothetical protein
MLKELQIVRMWLRVMEILRDRPGASGEQRSPMVLPEIMRAGGKDGARLSRRSWAIILVRYS